MTAGAEITYQVNILQKIKYEIQFYTITLKSSPLEQKIILICSLFVLSDAYLNMIWTKQTIQLSIQN
jgi:hypothetical protein